MKKIVSIVLICIYSLSTFGIGVKQFYCCGKLKSTGIAFVQDAKEKTGKAGMTGCCKTSFKSLKVKDSHVAGSEITNPVKQFTDLHLFTPSFEVTALANKPVNVTNLSNAPPLHYNVPIYILNCIYRI